MTLIPEPPRDDISIFEVCTFISQSRSFVFSIIWPATSASLCFLSSFSIMYIDTSRLLPDPDPIILIILFPDTMAPTSSTSSIVRMRSIASSDTFDVSARELPSGAVRVADIWVLSISPINSVPLETASLADNTRIPTARRITRGFTFKAPFNVHA